ncbi:cation:dicarboxylate symporter family transporter [Streptosporangium saharense]|uniref:Aerobic C4-dicarboxylate transport protein n=1 Tax=Streptosporangium saharense TaxID=1706840 RepID=A0A7W7QTU6_9ACTN|nr:cation:dicarboxylase symporter family transporter [Streptosporangium saharense]MBB4919652.1 aerobic C4-dicarboxylate transport protein [Streptosporangium saharense]
MSRDRTRHLYAAVLLATAVGAVVGLVAPETAKALAPLGTAFVALVKMMIGPVVFFGVVLGVGSVAGTARVGRIGGLALGYFLVMSVVALAFGLAAGNLVTPGRGLRLAGGAPPSVPAEAGEDLTAFLLGIIPATPLSAFTEGRVLQVLLVALLTGFALQAMGERGAVLLAAAGHLHALVLRVLSMIMWAAPAGALGATAAVVGATGAAALGSLAAVVACFYVTCLLFVLAVLGPLLWLVARVGLLSLLRYLGGELLLVLSTSSSETALPRLIAKLEHLGVSRAVAGVTVPTGYSFNLDGTAIYLTMATLFVATASGVSLSPGEQVSLLVFMLVASKGAAGVTGAGLATLAGGLRAHRPDLADGVGLLVGVDRFMSEARALTNFTGNAVAAILVGAWTGGFDRARAALVLSGREPFDESVLATDPAPAPPAREVLEHG